jgi:hypothetical protein
MGFIGASMATAGTLKFSAISSLNVVFRSYGVISLLIGVAAIFGITDTYKQNEIAAKADF